MNSLFTKLETAATPIDEGDAGIVLKKDGSFQVFNTHRNFDPKNMTERQEEQGRTLIALAVALKHPQVMDVLLDLANDPAIVGEVVEIIKAAELN